ncbi:MAG: AraC family transcriptional regulator [Deltaproteobacteria bacterium]|nr:AraC family transcriptional regulator [Deltaproteobacteria bacterium]
MTDSPQAVASGRAGRAAGALPDSPKSVDVLSEVLHAVRLRGAVYYAVSASSPWVAEAPPARELAPFVMPGAEHVIEYHVVTSGSCWAGLVGEQPVRLQGGDVIVFPQGDAHVVASSAGMRGPVDLTFHEQSALQRLPVRVDYGGTGQDPVQLVCGFLACDARPFNPLLSALPRVMHVKRRSGSHGEMLDHFMSSALIETCTPQAGGEVVLARLSELMFVEVVRQYVASLDRAQAGWLSGLRDDLVGRALAALHAHPARSWTLDVLAREVGASRSVLAQRFTQFVAVPPMQYLAKWRMQIAGTLFAGPSSMAEIAQSIGYGSEAAFSRAFKKTVGVAPAMWRAMRSVPRDCHQAGR